MAFPSSRERIRRPRTPPTRCAPALPKNCVTAFLNKVGIAMQPRALRLRAIDRGLDSRWETNQQLRIGRGDDCEVILRDTSISRRHAEIEFTGRAWVVRDLG